MKDNRVVIAAVLVVVVIISALALYFSLFSNILVVSAKTSSSPTSTAAGGLQIRVLQDNSGQPVADMAVLAGPVSSRNNLVFTPDGPSLKECVHEVANGSTVLGNGTVVLQNGTRITVPTCPPKDYTTNGTGWVSIPDATGHYYFFEVGTILRPEAHGIIELSNVGTTYLTVHMPSGNYTVTS